MPESRDVTNITTKGKGFIIVVATLDRRRTSRAHNHSRPQRKLIWVAHFSSPKGISLRLGLEGIGHYDDDAGWTIDPVRDEGDQEA